MQTLQTEAPEENKILILDDISDLVIKRFGEMKYGTWIIKYNANPNRNGKYGANAFNDRNECIRVVADTYEAAIEKVKREIDFSVKVKDISPKAKKVILDFNVEFTRDVMERDKATGVKFLNTDKGLFLVVTSAANYADLGFVALNERTPSANMSADEYTRMYVASPSVVEFRTLGMTHHGRYALEYEHDDADGNRVFRLVFDSVAKSSSDKVRLHRPGMIVAVINK